MTTNLSSLVFLKNAFANVIRGSFSALIAVILPPFLVRILPTETFSIWVLILQLTAYVGYFELGIQTTVGRFVAYANEAGDFKKRDRIINTSLAILSASGLLAVLFLYLLVWQLTNIFPKIPEELLVEAKVAILLIGSSLAIGLPFSVFSGIFIGIQRYEILAVIAGGSKLTTALLILTAAKISGNLVLMSASMAGVNLVSYVIQFLVCQKFNKDIKYDYKIISKDAAKEVFSYCFSLSIWSFTMILISGLDTTIVGIFNIKAVAYYSVAANLITLMIGLQVAIFNGLLPIAAVIDAREDGKQLGKLLIVSTRYGMFLLLATGIPLILGAKPLLNIWVGTEYAENGATILQYLVIANIIRLSCLPFATILVGTAQQSLVIISPFLEGFSNLIASIALGSMIGYTGVAIGTIVGAIFSVGGHIIYNMPRTKGITYSRVEFIKDGLFRPVACFFPILLVLPILNLFYLSLINVILLATISVILILVVTWKFGFSIKERHYVISIFNLMINNLKNIFS